MILDRLLEFRDRLPAASVVPEAHKLQTVRWFVEISPDGRVTGITETGAKKKDWKQEVAPYAKRTSATKPLLLVDKPDYVLGLFDEEKHEARTVERHAAYLDLLEQATRATSDETLATALRALRQPEQVEQARSRLAESKWAPGDLIAPRVGDELPHRQSDVQRFWQSREAERATDQSGFEASCLTCGETRSVARTHPIELQLAGNNVGLVTGNAAAFLSHGLQQSEIAPLCIDCARAYGEALRFLLQSDKHRLYVGGGVTWLFWTREPTEDLPFGRLFSDPTPDDVRRLLRAPHTGRPADSDDNAFYALVVSANKSRLVVRDWLALPVAEVKKSLASYFDRQSMLDYRGESPPLKLLALAGATVRDLKDLPPQTSDALLAHALTGRPLPIGLLHQAIRRAHADDRPITRPRAALIRLILTTLDIMADDRLTNDHPAPAYQCGRLLAVLDDIQRNAISPNATIVDRFYGSASTTPAAVLGVLVSKAQPHLAKLRKTKKGLYHYFENQLAEIAAQIDPSGGFPRTLTPEEQGLFALGFYQQRHRPKKVEDDGGDEEVLAAETA